MYPLYKATSTSLALCEHYVVKTKDMAYGYIRVRNLGMGDIGGTEKHNARQYEQGHYPTNIQEGGTFYHSYPATGLDEVLPGTSLKSEVQRRLDEHGIKPRKNQNVAIEFVCSASSDFWEVYNPPGHFSNTQKWLEDKYGQGSVVAMSAHYDETNPHCHFIVVPIEKKTVKWKNRNGSGEKQEARLTVRDITGGREKLRKLQDDYFAFISPYGAKYGVTFNRGQRKAANELDGYVKHTNHELGQIRANLAALSDDRQKLQALYDFKEKEATVRLKTAQLAKAAELEEKAKRKNWQRGIGSDFDTQQKPQKKGRTR